MTIAALNHRNAARSPQQKLADIRIEHNHQQPSASSLHIAYETTCVISNLSHTGIQLQSEPRLIKALFPNPSSEHQQHPLFHVSFETELPEGPDLISSECQVIYVRRTAKDSYIIGCEFKRFLEGSSDQLKEYLRFLNSEPSAQ